MKDNWTVQEIIRDTFSRWYVILIFGLVGAMVGFILSFLTPAIYQSNVDVIVGINTHRTISDRNTSIFAGDLIIGSLNDYKNWQMSSLNIQLLSPKVLNETKRRLESVDPAWSNYTLEDMKKIFDIEWKNPGIWTFTAEYPSKSSSEQALMIWVDVGFEHIDSALSNSFNAFQIDLQLQAEQQELTDTNNKQINTNSAIDQLNSFKNDPKSIGGGSQLSELDRWGLSAVVSGSGLNAGSLVELMLAFPDQSAPPSDYIMWIDKAIESMNIQKESLSNQMERLSTTVDQLKSDFSNTSRNSYGLSPFLVFDRGEDTNPETSKVNPSPTLLIAGSLLGLMVWGLILLGKIVLKAKK